MKYLYRTILLFLLHTGAVIATPLLDIGSDGWSILHVTDGTDPGISDADFHSTWYNQSLGAYTGASYNGPAFDPNKQAPFQYGNVTGLTGGTALATPPSGSRYTSYFIKVIDGGEEGAESLAISMLADDGAFVYLNGVLIARNNVSASDDYTRIANSTASETTYNKLALIGFPKLLPGPNLIAVSVHNRSSSSSDLGFDMTIEQTHTLIKNDSEAWSILNPLNGSNSGYDPATVDADFNTTWYNQSLGGYTGVSYDGPAFTTDQQAPFSYGTVDGITPNTVLTTPNSGSRGSAYFIHEIDGGTEGFSNLSLSLLADDGAFVYLNGKLIGVVGNGFNETTADTWATQPSGSGNESNVINVALFGNPVILPGPNLLAVSVHQVRTDSSDLGLGLTLTGETPPDLEITRSPYIQKVSTTRGTVRWRTAAPGNTVVRYGDSPTNLNQTFTITENAIDHVAEITGLTPETVYYYQVETTYNSETVTEGGTSEYYFKTYPTEKRDTRIWVIGDSGTADTNQKNVYDSYRTRTGPAHTDVWLMLGDNAYNSGTDTEFQDAVFDAYPELLRNTCMWSCIGNHEAYTAGGTPYIDIHSFPTNGECGGVASGTERYYSFDHGDIHFICLDSETSSNIDDVPGAGGMIDWLESDLKATDKNWIIAYFHHGPYTKGSHDSDTESHHIKVRRHMTPLLEKYGVDLVLSGHSHCYERSALINGHHGDSSLSTTYNAATMGIDTGNGSTTGSVDANGDFQVGVGADGAYQKPLATGNTGTIYSICGASGKLSSWDNGSSATVNPDPHPVFIVNLRVLGSLVLEVSGNTLNAKYIDDVNNVRDDFSIVKGSTVEIAATDSTFSETGDSVAQFNLTRTGATSLPLTVDYSILGTATNGLDYSAIPGSITFAADETSKTITLNALADSLAEGNETAQLSLTTNWQAAGTGGVDRPLYFLGSNNSGSANLADRAAHSWWKTHYGDGTVDWNSDTDNDSVSALLEYALGGDPNMPDAGILPTVSVENGMLSLHYNKNYNLTDITYQVEKSTTMLALTWDTLNVVDLLDGAANPTGVEKRKGTTPMQEGTQHPFLRLKVELK